MQFRLLSHPLRKRQSLEKVHKKCRQLPTLLGENMTTIRLYQNIPIVYGKHYVLNMNSQISLQTPVKTFNTLYHRFESTIDAPFPLSEIENCNYCSVQNAGERVYFLFIEKMEYVSPKNTKCYVRIDSFSTYFQSISFGECTVVRNHTKTDHLFEHLLQEDIGVQNMRHQPFEISADFSTDHGLFGASPYRIKEDGKLEDLKGGFYYGGIFQGVVYTNLTKTEPSDYITALAKENKIESLVSVFHFPESLMPDDNTPSVAKEIRRITPLSYQTIDSYTPKNKKCFTYPYYFLTIENGEGEELKIQFELLEDSSQISTVVYGIPTPTASVALLVENYDGAGKLKGVKFSDNNSIFMRNFPQASITSDSYLAWYAMNKNQREYSENKEYFDIGKTMISKGIVGLASPVAGAIGATNSLFDYFHFQQQTSAIYSDAKSLSDVTHGQASADAQWVTRDKSFHTFLNFPNYETIKTIDNYFTRYGYKIMKTQIPSFNNRPKFTFVQTQDCSVKGALPQQFKEEIEQIVNNGVTVWKNLIDFFDYSGNEV